MQIEVRSIKQIKINAVTYRRTSKISELYHQTNNRLSHIGSIILHIRVFELKVIFSHAEIL